MLRFEWNGLRVGDRVVVHDPPFGTEFPLLAGTVATVETKRSKRGANALGVRVATDGGGHRVVWPSYLAAHHDPPDPTERLLAMRGPRRDGGATARRVRGGCSGGRPMRAWEYLIVALPAFKAASATQGQSASVVALNHEGADGWEAVGMTDSRRRPRRRPHEARCGTHASA